MKIDVFGVMTACSYALDCVGQSGAIVIVYGKLYFDIKSIKSLQSLRNTGRIIACGVVTFWVLGVGEKWNYTMPFGIIHSKTPSGKVKRLIKTINEIKAKS